MKKLIMLDFDGTIAHLFKVFNLKNSAKIVNKALQDFGYNLSLENPFDIYDLDLSKEALDMADKIIENIENEAINTIIKVDYLDDYFEKLAKEYNLAIVTNNSKSSIEKFISIYYPNVKVYISGRDPKYLKPNPKPLIKALEYYNLKKEDAVFIGDGLIDMDAAISLGIDFIAMGTLDYKYKRFIDKPYPKAIVKNYKELYMELLKL